MSKPHPLGVRPIGNMYSEDAACCIRQRSLGRHISLLPDDVLCRLLTFCDAASLRALALSSRACYAFSRDEDLWRALTLNTYASDFRFAGSWRCTYTLAERMATQACGSKRPRATVQAVGVYSDVLFHKWRCMSAVMQPEWMEVSNVERVDGGRLSGDEFYKRFEEPGTPVILTGVVPNWRASERWNSKYLRDTSGDAQFVAGGFEFSMSDYLDYAAAIEGKCDQPLYLFDSDFARKQPALGDDYETPHFFAEDLFQHMGRDMRPNYRWLIVGPRNSGSSFHKDPNATSAWNACVRGSKRWIMFPPDSPPPGVHPTADESDVTAPLSVLEWYVNFYESSREVGKVAGAVEATVQEGEIIFVPSGWWHAVINLEFSVAVTQNYVSRANFARVAQWLATKPEQVSGCRDSEHARYVAANFASRVVAARPQLRHLLGGREGGCDGGGSNEDSNACLKRRRKDHCGLWDTLKLSTSEPAPDEMSAGKQFSFGFG